MQIFTDFLIVWMSIITLIIIVWHIFPDDNGEI